ncbi:MAG: phage tail family protein [Bacillota bacterium]
MLYELKYINNLGHEVSFGGEAIKFIDTIEIPSSEEKNPFSLIKFEGFGEVEASIQMQNAPYQDGSTHIDTRLEERHPYIEFIIRADDFMQLSYYRRYVSKVFNPKHQGKFELIYGDKTFVIDAIPEQVPSFPDEGTDANGRTQTVSVNLTSPDPYWRENFIKSQQMSFVMGGFSFPLRLGTQFSQRSFRRIFLNDGDVETPVHIEFRGPAINPVIKNNTTGEFIQVNRTLSETDKLIIDTTFGQKSVEIEDAEGNRTDAFNWINPQSWFFQLQIGENQLEYNSNNDSTKTRVVISYRNMYVGV